jgi:hypothetical protein
MTFEKRVLRRIFGPRRDEVTGEWRRLHKEELCVLYAPVIIQLIKSRRPRWAEHVARVGRKQMYTGSWWENLREGNNLGNLGVDGRIILKLIFEK